MKILDYDGVMVIKFFTTRLLQAVTEACNE